MIVPSEEEPEEPVVPTMHANNRRRSGSASDREKKSKAKTKERSEGEALKNPNAAADKKDKLKQLTSGRTESAQSSAVDEAISKASNGSKPPPISKDPPQISDLPLSNTQTREPSPKSAKSKSAGIHRDFGRCRAVEEVAEAKAP